MRIEQEGELFGIVRGHDRSAGRLRRASHESYFCFFVDRDSASWTSRSPWNARRYKTREDAEKDLAELKRRANLKRKREHPSP